MKYILILFFCFLFFSIPKTYAEFWHKCSTFASPVTMEKIAYVESAGKPYVIRDNTANQSYVFNNNSLAVGEAEHLLGLNHNIDMGLVQINSVNTSKLDIPITRIFNPCYNIYIGSYILNEDYSKAVLRFGETPITLFRTLEDYNSGSFYGDNQYALHVWNALNK